MYNFKIDVNDKSPVITKEDYGNILLLDFHKDSPFLIHTRYDPFKFSMLSKREKVYLKLYLNIQIIPFLLQLLEAIYINYHFMILKID